MFSAIFAILSVLQPICHALGHDKFEKPTFSPYCIIKETCRSVCTCHFTDECQLLQMNDAIRNSVTFYHNQIRQIQTIGEPEPSGMPAVQYDLQLEQIAKCWALRCENAYSACYTTPRFKETSQSVFQLTRENANATSNFVWLEIMNYWFGNVVSMNVDFINVMPGGEQGEKLHNYAQLLSDQVLFIGCGWSWMKSTVTFVCSYGPRGPVFGEAIYKRGKPCTECPENYFCDHKKPFQNLCKLSGNISTTTLRTPPPSLPPQPPSKSYTPPLPPTGPPTLSPIIPNTAKPPRMPYFPPDESLCAPNCNYGNQKAAFVETTPNTSPLMELIEYAKQGQYPQQTIPSTKKGFDADQVEIISKDVPNRKYIIDQKYVQPTDSPLQHDGIQNDKNPNNVKLQSDFIPLVPLRDIPNTKMFSPSLLPQPIISVSHPEDYAKVSHRSEILEAKDFDTLRLVPSYHPAMDRIPSFNIPSSPAPSIPTRLIENEPYRKYIPPLLHGYKDQVMVQNPQMPAYIQHESKPHESEYRPDLNMRPEYAISHLNMPIYQHTTVLPGVSAPPKKSQLLTSLRLRPQKSNRPEYPDLLIKPYPTRNLGRYH